MEFSHKSAVGWLSVLWSFFAVDHLIDMVKSTEGFFFMLSLAGLACSAILAVAAFLQWRKM